MGNQNKKVYLSKFLVTKKIKRKSSKIIFFNR